MTRNKRSYTRFFLNQTYLLKSLLSFIKNIYFGITYEIEFLDMPTTNNVPSKEDKINILYVDDEPNNLFSFKAAFRRDFNVFTAESGAEGRQVLDNNDISIVITDQRMPQMTGVEFLESIVEAYPETIRLLITGFSDIQAVIDAINKGRIYHYVQKPWDETYLRNIINNAFETHRLRKENKYMMEQLKITNEQLEFMLRQELLS